MKTIIRVMFTGFVVSITGCGEGGNSPPTAPESREYALKPVAPANAAISLFSLGENLAGRVRVDVYHRELSAHGGILETRVASESGDAADMFSFSIPIYPGDFDGNTRVDLDDFLLFADVFGEKQGSEKFGEEYDLDGNGVIDFVDFFVFADFFGRSKDSGSAGKRASEPNWSVAYQDAPRGGMDEESFVRALGILQERSSAPAPAGKLLQFVEPEYRFHVQSLEEPPLFSAFDVFVAGSFPETGEEPRELWVTPEGATPPPVVTESFIVTPTDTTVAFGAEDGVGATGLLTTLHNNQPVGVQEVAVELTGQDLRPNEDGSLLVWRAYTYNNMQADQWITVLSPPDITPPVVTLSVSGTVAAYTISEDESLPVNYTLTAGTDESLAEVTEAVFAGETDYNFLEPGEYEVVFAATDASGNRSNELREILTVPERVAVVNTRLMRYLSATAGGRLMDIRVDVAADEPVATTASVVAYKDGEEYSSFSVELDQSSGSSNHRWGFLQFSVPENTATRTIAWRVEFVGETLRNGAGTASLEFTQDAATSPPPQPEPDPPTPPPPANVAASINSATVNGVAPGGIIGPVAFGSTLTLVTSVSGTPTPSVAWSLAGNTASGTSTTTPAKSGTLTLTVNNSVGSPDTRTWTIITFGAP